MCAALPTLKVMGPDVDSCPWRDECVTVLSNIRDGHLTVPDVPGWGPGLNEAAAVAGWNGQGQPLTPNAALCTIAFPNRGALAQLGERHNGIVEVMGSSPISSIRIRRRVGTGL